jgi:hypothetical protein
LLEQQERQFAILERLEEQVGAADVGTMQQL